VERSFAWLENADGSGKILNACSTPACNSLIWLFWLYCCGDIEQALSKVAAQNLPITQLYEQEPNARLGNRSAD
jgi:hypothetical protein